MSDEKKKENKMAPGVKSQQQEENKSDKEQGALEFDFSIPHHGASVQQYLDSNSVPSEGFLGLEYLSREELQEQAENEHWGVNWDDEFSKHGQPRAFLILRCPARPRGIF